MGMKGVGRAVVSEIEGSGKGSNFPPPHPAKVAPKIERRSDANTLIPNADKDGGHLRAAQV